MKLAVSVILSLALIFTFVAGVDAADKEVTLTGKITCPKCDLKTEKKCATVVVVNEKGKDVLYYFDKESNGKYHKDICTEGKEGSVVGVVTKKDGKSIVKVTKVEYK